MNCRVSAQIDEATRKPWLLAVGTDWACRIGFKELEIMKVDFPTTSLSSSFSPWGFLFLIALVASLSVSLSKL